MTNSPALGEHWESVAWRYLSKHNIDIIGRRYRCRFGEIDLIGIDRNELVMFEVKARSSNPKVHAAETIDHFKQARILRAAEFFLMRNDRFSSWPIRLDVIAIHGIDTQRPQIEWIRNAFVGS